MESKIIEGRKKFIRFTRLLLVAGILNLILGIVALIYPVQSFSMLVLIFSTGILITGVFEIFYSISNRKAAPDWYLYLFGGFVNLIVGITLLYNPLLSMIVLSIYIGLLLLFRSIFAIISALATRKQGNESWSRLLFIGFIGLIVSLLVLWNPEILGVTIGVWLGMILLLIGIAHIVIAVHLRRIRKFGDDVGRYIKDQ